MPAMRATSAPLSLANESQFLVVCEPSVADLNMRLASLPEPTAVTASRFRPNLVLQGGVPYQEDHWRTLHIGELRLRCMGSCGRCTMINVDPATAAMSTEPLNTLSSYRRSPNVRLILVFVVIWVRFRGTNDLHCRAVCCLGRTLCERRVRSLALK
jgi:molybdenum cofactor sulfurtransferase